MRGVGIDVSSIVIGTGFFINKLQGVLNEWHKQSLYTQSYECDKNAFLYYLVAKYPLPFDLKINLGR